MAIRASEILDQKDECEYFAQELDQIEALLDGFNIAEEKLSPIAKRVKEVLDAYDLLDQRTLRHCNVCGWNVLASGIGCYKCLYEQTDEWLDDIGIK